jgi:hypothetical protein
MKDVRIKLNEDNVKLFEEFRKMFLGYIPRVDEMGYNGLIRLLHHGFNIKQLADELGAKVMLEPMESFDWDGFFEEGRDE